MDCNPFGAPLKLDNPPVKRKRPFNRPLLVIVIWFSLPLIAIGGMLLLALSGHQIGD